MSKEQQYTLRDAVETFYDNEDIISVECYRKGRDLSDEIISLDMGEGDRFFIRFESFMMLVQNLDYYKINVIDEKDKCGFEFSIGKDEYYKFIYKKE